MFSILFIEFWPLFRAILKLGVLASWDDLLVTQSFCRLGSLDWLWKVATSFKMQRNWKSIGLPYFDISCNSSLSFPHTRPFLLLLFYSSWFSLRNGFVGIDSFSHRLRCHFVDFANRHLFIPDREVDRAQMVNTARTSDWNRPKSFFIITDT